MPLKSNLFRSDTRLNACLVSDPSHVKQGAHGDFVAKIQVALIDLDGARIAEGEIKTQTYGPTTAAAVLAYKRKRKIINKAYQTAPDDIVGKMTIAALDEEMFQKQEPPRPPSGLRCYRKAHTRSSPAPKADAALAAQLANGRPFRLV